MARILKRVTVILAPFLKNGKEGRLEIEIHMLETGFSLTRSKWRERAVAEVVLSLLSVIYKTVDVQ